MGSVSRRGKMATRGGERDLGKRTFHRPSLRPRSRVCGSSSRTALPWSNRLGSCFQLNLFRSESIQLSLVDSSSQEVLLRCALRWSPGGKSNHESRQCRDGDAKQLPSNCQGAAKASRHISSARGGMDHDGRSLPSLSSNDGEGSTLGVDGTAKTRYGYQKAYKVPQQNYLEDRVMRVE